jgi:hypothetical protein
MHYVSTPLGFMCASGFRRPLHVPHPISSLPPPLSLPLHVYLRAGRHEYMRIQVDMLDFAAVLDEGFGPFVQV